MATKLKSNKSISNIIYILIITIASLAMILCYPKIEKTSNNYKENIYENENFLNALGSISYYLYYDILSNGDKNVNPSDIIANIKQENYYKEDFKYQLDSFNSDTKNNLNLLERDYSYLDYYVFNKENNVFRKRSSKDLEMILNNDVKLINDMKNYYDFYIVMDFDNYGNLTINNIHGANQTSMIGKLYSSSVINQSDLLELKPIKNMQYIYAIPKQLSNKDILSGSLDYNNYLAYIYASEIFLSPFIIGLCLVGFFIPYKLQSESSLFKKVAKYPIEIVLILAIIFLDGSRDVIAQTLENRLTTNKELDYIVNFIFWFINFGNLYLLVVLTKYIFRTGFLGYIKSNLLVVKFIKYISNKSKVAYNFLINVDFKDKNNKKMLLLVGIQFILISFMCLTWWFGILLCILYTIAFYMMLTKYYKKVQNDYIELLNATEEMSNGNLDISLEKDLGLFNSLKNNLLDLNSGFKKAVDKEIKSEKMKTELISNVSHDLKTPLTSIITYTDLLKNEDLEKDKQQEYIEVLDKKSQRLKVLIEDLFEVSKANSGNISLNLVDVDVVSLIKQTIFELDDKIKEKSLIIKSNMPNEKIILNLDSQRTFRVFENLIINITKYALENSRVYIDVCNNDDSVSISFKNISKDEIDFTVDEIEERFVRGDKSRTTEGSGLGLSIAKSFVTLQNGTFDIILDGDLFKVIITFNKQVKVVN